MHDTLMAAALSEPLTVVPDHYVPELRTAPAATHPCQMYLDHGSAQPSVTQGHHTRPVFLQNRKYGRIRDGSLLWLCGTDHDSLHAWLYYLLGERKMPDPLPPRRARRWAEEVYAWYVADSSPQ